VIVERCETLVIARAATAERGQSPGELVKPLARFAPAELAPAAWLDQLAATAAGLAARGVLDPGHQLRDPGELARRIGRTTAARWPELTDRVLPGLGLGLAGDDSKALARLRDRDAWVAAILGRSLGLWRDGPPLSLSAVCDALTWRALGLTGTPKRCPPEVRAVFVQRELRSEPGPLDRLARLLAAREVAAPRPELRALRDALVKRWLAGRVLGAAPAAASAPVPASHPPASHPPASHPPASHPHPPASASHPPAPFADAVLRAARAATSGRFGDRKVFVSAVWHELHKDPAWSQLALDELKPLLAAAHRAGQLVLARADLVAAMDPELVACSEIASDGARFHFVVVEPA
jgi:hypothetical protein